MASIRDLVVSLGLDFDGSGFDKADVRINSLKVGLGSVASTVAAVGAALSAVTISVVKSIDETYDQAAALGVATDELQRLGYAAQMSGSNAEQLTAALGVLQRSAYAAAEGSKEAAEIYSEFGINLKDNNGNLRSASDLLLDIADGVNRIKSPTERAGMLAKVLGRGFGPQLQQFLAQGSDGIKELGKELDALGGVYDSQTIESSREFADTMDKMHAAIKGAALSLAKAFLPTLKDATKQLDMFWMQNGAAVRSGIGTFARGVASAFELVAKVVGYTIVVFDDLFALFGPLRTVMMSIAAAAIIIAAAFLSPAAAVAVLVGVFVLLADEINTFVEGGESVLGDFFSWIGAGFDWVSDKIKSLDEFLGGFLSKFGNVVLSITGQAGVSTDDNSSKLSSAPLALSPSPIAAAAGSAILPSAYTTNSQTVSVAAPITVNAAPGQSPEEIGKEVSKQIGAHLNREIAAARPAAGVTYRGGK